MRIIYIFARSDAIGGASIHVRDLASRMQAEGHEVLVILGAGSLLTNALSERGVAYYQINSFRREPHPIRDISAFASIFRKLLQWKPDIVSTHTSKAGFLGRMAACLLRIPVLYTPHCWSFTENFPRAKWYRTLERVCRFATTHFVAVSEFEKQEGIRAGVCRQENVTAIHNGMIDFEGARALPGKTPPQLVMVARFEAQKNHRALIEVLAKLKDLEWSLCLVGEGPLQSEIKERVRALSLEDRVAFLGHSDEVSEVLQRSQIFVLSTHWESFPRSILEAMRAGLPIVVSDVGGCSESVQDGHNGFVVPPGRQDVFQQRLKSLIISGSLREKMGLHSRLLYEQKFTFETMFERYRKLYRQFGSDKDKKN